MLHNIVGLCKAGWTWIPALHKCYSIFTHGTYQPSNTHSYSNIICRTEQDSVSALVGLETMEEKELFLEAVKKSNFICKQTTRGIEVFFRA